MWWEGPQFLKLGETGWPCAGVIDASEEAQAKDLPEIAFTLATSSSVSNSFSHARVSSVVDCAQFSSLHRLLTVIAYALRFIRRCRSCRSCIRGAVQYQKSLAEITETEKYWIRCIQYERLQDEMRHLQTNRPPKPCLIDQFGLFTDKDQIVRCRGRLNNSTLPLGTKNPILLPYNHCFVKLLIIDVHERLNHSGVNDTLATVCEDFWVLKGRQAVKQIIRHCITCKKMDGHAYPPVNTPDLPTVRVSDDAPFSNTGVDFAGPLYISRPNEPSKVYVCLFTCASTRAIHLELVPSLNTESFLLAFCRIVGRRGLPTTLLSDNAKTLNLQARRYATLWAPEKFPHT